MFYAYGSNDAGKLASLLGVSVVFPYGNDNIKDPYSYSIVREGRMRRFVNYGCRASRGVCFMADTINACAENAAMKVKAFEMFDAAGIRHPRLVDPTICTTEFIGRADGKSQGRGMYLYRAGQALREGVVHDFFVEKLPFGREYRLHGFEGEIILSANKLVPYNFRGIARTHRNGCRMIPGDVKKMPSEAPGMALRALEVLGLHFGAVDVYETPDGTPYILEVNTAPGLEYKASLDAYTNAFKRYMRV